MFCFKKKFGQNFLINQSIIQRITDCFLGYKKVFEIGPGNGALTKFLLEKGIDVLAIDIDPDCIDALKTIGNPNLELVQADVLNYKIPDLPVVGNLPYNISSKIVEKLVEKPIEYAVLMFQKEVADILTGKDYGRLTIFAQSKYRITKLVEVSSNNFCPRPKVDSQVVIFERLKDGSEVDLIKLNQILFLLFQNRRKMVGHIRKSNLKLVECMQSIGIDLTLRPENITKEKYYELSKIYAACFS